jgi:exodeoxyribonuclease-3
MAPPLAIATWNVNSVRTRLAHVWRFLRSDYPDVLCLQELKVEAKDFPGDEFKKRGYHVVKNCQKTYNGVAIVSPYPITDVQEGFASGTGNEEARLITATVRGVRVMCAYVPNGQDVESDKYTYKLDWMRRLRAELDRADPAEPRVLCGDFNVAMDDRDLYDPKGWEGRVLCSEPEREGARRWQAWGLFDTFRKHHDEAGVYSWWDYRQGGFARDRGLRIDHVWATRPMLERCVGCEVVKAPRGWEQPSDHAPVVALFAGLDS